MSMSLEAYWACPHCGINYLIQQQAWAMNDCCQAFFNSWVFQRLTEIEEFSEVKKFTDQQFIKFNKLEELIFKEHEHQIKKWGVQTHSIWEWLGYTTEELGSLAKAVGEWNYREGPSDKIVSEAIQVATLALKIAEMFLPE